MITRNDIDNLVEAANLAGFQIQSHQIQLLTWNAGLNTHVPTSLPKGKQAVYIFECQDVNLKVGKAGANSQARYQSHHYSIEGNNSSLANSLHKDTNFETPHNGVIDTWIKHYTTRYNLLFDVKFGKPFLNFVEAFFILKCNPKYEG